MRSEKNVTYLMTASELYNSAGTLSTITTGQVGVVCVKDASGTLATDQLYSTGGTVTAAGDIVKFWVNNSDGTIQTSDSIAVDDIISINVESYTKNQMQIDYIGYNGTSGEIDVINSNNYYVSLTLYGATQSEFARQYKKFGVYKSPSSGTTQYLVADNIVDSLIRQVSRDKEIDMIFDVSHDDTTVNSEVVDADEILKLTKGSKVVAFYSKADGTTAGTGTAVANTKLTIPSIYGRTFTFTAGAGAHKVYIGDQIFTVSDAGASAANGTAIATAINASTAVKATASDNGAGVVTIEYDDDFYACPPVVYDGVGGTTNTLTVTIATGDTVPTVYNIDTGGTNVATITLDRAWQGETCFVDGDTGVSALSATKSGIVTPTNYGIKISGKPRSVSAGFFQYDPIRFQTSIQDFGDTTIVESQGARIGTGLTDQVAQLEYELKGNEGTIYRVFPYQQEPARRASVVDVRGYDLVTIRYKSKETFDVGIAAYSVKELILAIDRDNSNATSVNFATLFPTV